MNKFISVIIALTISSVAYADSAGLSFDTGGTISIKGSDNATVLSGGTALAGDGFVVEIGYYSTASAGNNFSGNWISIAGGGSLNTAFAGTSIGDINDNGAGDGTYANTLVFDTTLPNTVVALPSAGQVMTVRFYNAATLSAATHFAAVSNNTWTWLAPAVVQSNMTYSLDDIGVVWQGSFVGYTGNIISAVPEPAAYAALLGVGAMGLVVWRKRRKA